MDENKITNSSEPLPTLGERLKKLRKERGWNQEKLAETAGINRSYLSNIENGHNSPTIDTLDKLARALGVGLAEIFPDGIIRGNLLQSTDTTRNKGRSPSDDLLIEERRIEYDTDVTFDIYPGLREFLDDEDEMMLTQPSPEEIRHLKGIGFRSSVLPDKRFYRDALLAFRRRRQSSS